MDQIIEPNARGAGTDGENFTRLLDVLATNARERELDRVLPYDVMEQVRLSRVGALRISREEGGGGATSRELFGAIIRLAAADPNVTHILRNHFSFVERFIRQYHDPKSHVWRDAAVDGAIFGLAYGELDTKRVGSLDLQTTLVPEAEHYRLNGTKYYCTGTLYADYLLVRCITQDGTPASVIIPCEREGLERIDDWDGFGQRLTGSGTTILRNVRVDLHEVVLDSEGTHFGQAYAGSFPQLILTAINVGILHSILQDATSLVRGRVRSYSHAPTERPADDPLLQQVVGQIASFAFAAEATVLAAADSLDTLDALRGAGRSEEAGAHEASLLASKAKVVVDELVIRGSSLLLDVGGASATKRGLNLDRHWRNARTLASHNPTVYKARAIGDNAINGTPLPVSGFF